MDSGGETEIRMLSRLRQLLLESDLSRILKITTVQGARKTIRLSHVHELFEIRILLGAIPKSG